MVLSSERRGLAWSSSSIVSKRIKCLAKKQARKSMRERWEEKPMHGQYPTRVNRADADQQKTHTWLKSSGLKAETEGLIIAAQDQSLLTNSYQKQDTKEWHKPKLQNVP